MKPRNTLIVVAVLVALLAYLYFVELPQTPEQLSARMGTPTATPASYMFQLDATQVKSYIVTDLRAPRSTTVVRTDAGWFVTQPSNAPADQNKADAVASALAKLKIVRVYPNVTNIAAFGVVSGLLEARVIMNDGTAYGLTVGNKTPDDMSYYAVYTGDQSKVFLIESPLIESLKVILDVPPFQPTDTPTPTVTPPVTPAAEGTPAPPGFVPTLLPTPAATVKP